ncbi:unnamed protein product [Heterobilharzia americana]|nr:unnamed protein product [Heterobilharzia americana]
MIKATTFKISAFLLLLLFTEHYICAQTNSISRRFELTMSHEATRNWYDEINKHDFNGQNQAGTGHFTQVVWKSSKKAGFGAAKSKDGMKIYVVGRYRPAGNVIGHYIENVPKPKKAAPSAEEFNKKFTSERKCSIL